MLQCRLAQVVFIGDCPQHSVGIHRSKVPQLNFSDAVADVIVPDFLVALLCRGAFFFEKRQVDFVDKLRQSHSRFRREIAGVQLAQELGQQRLDVGFAWLVLQGSQPVGLLLEFDRTVFLSDALSITHQAS